MNGMAEGFQEAGEAGGDGFAVAAHDDLHIDEPRRPLDGDIATSRTKDAAASTAEASAVALPADAGATASPEPTDAPARVEAMRGKIKAGGYGSPYRLRKQLPEPVFGQIKQAREFRQFAAHRASRRCARNGALSAPPTIC